MQDPSISIRDEGKIPSCPRGHNPTCMILSSHGDWSLRELTSGADQKPSAQQRGGLCDLGATEESMRRNISDGTFSRKTQPGKVLGKDYRRARSPSTASSWAFPAYFSGCLVKR